MDRNLFEKIDPLVDDIADQITELIEGEGLSGIRQKLVELSREFGTNSLTLELNVKVFDANREQNLPLLQTGLATSEGSEPDQFWADSSPQRYVVDGEMAIVPNDRCPQCWGEWGFKNLHPQCAGCGAQMGIQVKLLLDSDRCPHCERGVITSQEPKCSECGFTINPEHVIWG